MCLKVFKMAHNMAALGQHHDYIDFHVFNRSVTLGGGGEVVARVAAKHLAYLSHSAPGGRR